MLSIEHIAFDFMATLTAIAGGFFIYQWRFREVLQQTASTLKMGYFFALSTGSLIGAFVLGTANLYLSGEALIGRSILGALFGATLAVELYKARRGTKGSTGYIFVIPLCLLIIVGRLGCFFSGLNDHTYGLATPLPWGVDFGDGVMRHPVQLYESLSMLGFLIIILTILKSRVTVIINYGYYFFTGFYALQRFFWEFLKPYGSVIGHLNIFHLVCLVLIFYSMFMMLSSYRGHDSA